MPWEKMPVVSLEGGAMLERRARRRFRLTQPVLLSSRQAAATFELSGITENVSETGLLLEIDSYVPTGTQVDLTLSLVGPDNRVQLFSPGKVLRAQCQPNGRTSIAVECTHALEQLTPAQVT